MIDQTTETLSLQEHYTVVGSIHSEKQLKNSCFYSWHLYQTQYNNKRYSIETPREKKYLADILLGNGKSHRIDLFKKIKQTGNLLDKCLVNLHQQFGVNHGHEVYSSPELAELELSDVLKIKNNESWTSTDSINRVNCLGQPQSMWVCQSVPDNIYQNSYLTVVSETLVENNHFFPTEKIAKPIIAGRIFLVSAGKNYLANLRRLGFKTFESFIDERYDHCDTVEQRNSAIVAELQRLQNIDILDLYCKALPILEHNQQLIYSKKLWQPAREFIEQIFKKHRT